MALPAELRQVLFEKLPFFLTENWPLEPFRLWFGARGLDIQLAKYRTESLTEHELLLKVAAWAGESGYTNQLFLPAGLPLALAAQDRNLALYADLSLRSYEGEYTLLQILQQPSQSSILYFLAYYSLQDHSSKAVPQLLVDYILLGRIVLSEVTIRFLGRSNIDLVKDLANGYLNVLTSGKEGTFTLSSKFFAFGYLLAGGNMFDLNAILKHQNYQEVIAYLNLPVAGISDLVALENLADQIIALRPRTGNLKFPTVNILEPRELVILRPRARSLLELVPQIYAKSYQRRVFIAQLQLLLDPETTKLNSTLFPNFQIPILVGRFDLIMLDKFHIEPVISYVEDVLKFTTLLLKFNQCLVTNNPGALQMLMGRAVLTRQFAECSALIFQSLPLSVRKAQSILDFSSFSSLDDYFYQTQDEKKQSIPFTNSFVLQWVFTTPPHGKRTLILRRSAPTHEKNKSRSLDFQYGSYVIREQVSLYEQETWQRLGLPIPAANTTHSSVLQTLAKHIALAQELLMTQSLP